MAYNDTISVWEDESIAFDALANDNFAGDNASIVEYTKVRSGFEQLLVKTSLPLLNSLKSIYNHLYGGKPIRVTNN